MTEVIFLKKIICLFLSALLCISVTACSGIRSTEPVTTASVNTQTQTKKNKTANKAAEKTEKKQASSKKENTSKKSIDEKTVSETVKEKVFSSKNTKPSESRAETSRKKTTAKKKTTVRTTKVSSFSCYVTIECTSILDNMDKLKSGHEKYVPSNGVIMDSARIVVEEGQSVYDAVKSACSANSVKLNEQGSMYGKYIVGFNNIDEKDCGSQSGWVYTVNGSRPPKSCDKYTLKKGDKIIFSYICNF